MRSNLISSTRKVSSVGKSPTVNNKSFRRKDYGNHQRTAQRLLWLVLIIVVGYFIINSQYWRVREVSCRISGETVDSLPESWCDAAKENTLDQSIFLINWAKLEKILVNLFPPISRIDVSKNWPAGLTVTFSVRTPVLAVNTENLESTASGVPLSYFLVDETGLIFKKASDSASVPKLSYPGGPDLRTGEYLEKGFLSFVISLVKELNQQRLVSESAKREEESTLVIQVKNGPVVFFSSAKEAKTQALILQLVLEKYRIEGRALKRVDLRFKDPVVEY